MKNFICAGILLVSAFSCSNRNDAGMFSLSGEVKNLPDQKVFLEEIHFDDKGVEVLDTAEAKQGKFVLRAIAPQEGLFKVRFEKSEAVFLVINDKADLSVTADINNLVCKNGQR